MTVGGAKRIAETSSGWLELDLQEGGRFGFTVRVVRFGQDGWEIGSKAWMAKYGHHHRDESLEEFLASYADVPEAEAAALARRIEDEWLPESRRRGGVEEVRSLDVWTTFILVLITVLIVLALVGLAALVLMIIRFVQ